MAERGFFFHDLGSDVCEPILQVPRKGHLATLIS
jgi:hypothetical protein